MKNKLSPFDCDMCAMIENITKTPVEVTLNDDVFTIKASLLGVASNTIKALEGALKGRTGTRFVSFENPGVEMVFKFKNDPEYNTAPDQMRYDLTEPKEVSGTTYCRKLKEVNAVLFTEQSVEKVVAFTGGGTLTVPSSMNIDASGMNEPAFYEFPTENGVLLRVFEGEYIVKENGHFTTMRKTAFERDFEPK